MANNIHNNWGQNVQPTAKCDWCSKKNINDILLRCKVCYLNACRACVANGHLEDEKHGLLRTSVDTFNWEKPQKGKSKNIPDRQSTQEPDSGVINNAGPREQSVASPVAPQSSHPASPEQPGHAAYTGQPSQTDYFGRPVVAQPYYGHGYYPTPMTAFGPRTHPGQMGGMPYGGIPRPPYGPGVMPPHPGFNMMAGPQGWAGSPQGAFGFPHPHPYFNGGYHQGSGYGGVHQQPNQPCFDPRSPEFVPEKSLPDPQSLSFAPDPQANVTQVVGKKRARSESPADDSLAQERDNSSPYIRRKDGENSEKVVPLKNSIQMLHNLLEDHPSEKTQPKKLPKTTQVKPPEEKDSEKNISQMVDYPSGDYLFKRTQPEMQIKEAQSKLAVERPSEKNLRKTTIPISSSTYNEQKDNNGAKVLGEDGEKAAEILVSMSQGLHQSEVNIKHHQVRRGLPEAPAAKAARSPAPSPQAPPPRMSPPVLASQPSRVCFDKGTLDSPRNNTSRGRAQPTVAKSPAKQQPPEFKHIVFSAFQINPGLLRERDGHGEPTARAMALEDAWKSIVDWIVEYFGNPSASDLGLSLHVEESWAKMQTLSNDDNPRNALSRIAALSVSEKIRKLLCEALQK